MLLQVDPGIAAGNTAWVLTAAALVLFMTPGLGFFYGGFTRSKNVLATIMQSFIVVALVSIQWVVIGYTLAFGPDHWGIIGGLDYFGLKDVGAEVQETYTGFSGVPHEGFMVFQLMFAIITPALITGAFAERAKFSTFLVFMLAWSLLVYNPVAHWVFGTGFLGVLDPDGINALDFAGGTAIHVNAGAAALAAAVFFGRRKGYGSEPMEPSNITYIVLGTAMLWFGWFGFNAGSAGAANSQAVNAFVVTNTAAAGAAFTWMMLSWFFAGKPSVVGACAGAVAGLVAITPASGFVQPMEALGIGVGAGVFCYLAVRLRARTSLDDSLDVVGVHGIGGLWGGIATGLFATAVVSGVADFEGLMEGNASQLGDQLAAIGIVAAYSFIMTSIILKVLDVTMGLRVSDDEEVAGLDVTQHGERAYVLEEAPSFQGIPQPAGARSASTTTQQSPAPAPSPSGGGAS
ncbi:MAG: ammonium transporter [Dehalococcoidia bacterium]